MLTNLEIKNFKGFEATSFDIKPITLLLGPNNSGKSAAISPIKLLAQTLESYDRAIPLLLRGKFFDFGTYKDLVYSNNIQRMVSIVVESTENRPASARPNKKSGRKIRLKMTYKFKPKLKQIVIQSMCVTCDDKDLATFAHNADSEKLLYNTILGRSIEPGLKKAN